MNTKKTISFAGGGTWWHVKPIQSLLEYVYNHDKLLSQCQEFFWFGEKDGWEEEICKQLQNNTKVNNLTFVSIYSWKFRREKTMRTLFLNVRDLFFFVIWIFQSIYYLKKHKIWTIFCKWGFVALPVVIAGKILWKKIFTHESDTRAWIVNTLSSKFSVKNFTWFPDVLPNSICVGQILSKKIINCRNLLSVKPNNKQTKFLVLWWSQWSQTLYQALDTIFREDKKILEQSQFFIVWGLLNKNLQKLFPKHKNLHIFDFLSSEELWKIYLQSDVAITRAWVTSLEEMQLFNIKKIIVPLPCTHDQEQNAKWYVERYWDIYLDQEDKNFVKNLKKSIFEYINYQKKEVNLKEVWEKIEVAKKIIWEEMITE